MTLVPRLKIRCGSLLQAFRNFANDPPKVCVSEAEKNKEKADSSPSSIWQLFRKTEQKGKKDESVKKKPEEQPCVKRGQKRKPDPDLSGFGGQPYRSCGPAYVIQKDLTSSADMQMTDEERILRKIEADLTLKDSLTDPMPPFKSVEQRMLDLCEKGLHPFYKRYMSIPKVFATAIPEVSGSDDVTKTEVRVYESRSGPIRPEEIPKNLKLNTELLEKKNIFADFKQVELPRQILARMAEMEKNRKPTLEPKKGKENVGEEV